MLSLTSRHSGCPGLHRNSPSWSPAVSNRTRVVAGADTRPVSHRRGAHSPPATEAQQTRPLPSAPMNVLLVTLYFPPAGGGGVQRALKFASHLPALGVETHVLAPDDPKWIHADDQLPLPTQAWIHRARYIGPAGRRIGDELHTRTGLDLV